LTFSFQDKKGTKEEGKKKAIANTLGFGLALAC
jgi:hypothetical protein